MDARSRPCFTEEDVLNIFPVTKHINPRASDAYTFYTTGQTKIQQGYLKEGHELITEALNLLNSVYGAMHPGELTALRGDFVRPVCPRWGSTVSFIWSQFWRLGFPPNSRSV